MKHNEHQVEDAKKMAKDFGVNININSARANLKQNYLSPVDKLIDNYGEWLPDNPEYNAYDMDTKTYKPSHVENKKKFCRKPWMETSVNWNGDVFPCCAVHTEAKDRMGNIFEQDFKEIWNGEKYIAARKEMLDQPNDLETICHTCKKNGYDLS